VLTEAQKVTLRNEPDEFVTFDDREVTEPVFLHAVLRELEILFLVEDGDLARHEVAHQAGGLLGHTAF
jgi:hypothetical protein